MTLGTRTILVVDDQPSVRRLVSRCLAQSGFLPIEAVDGLEATRVARLRRVDLLIADVVMPGTTGPHLAGFLRRAGLVDRFLFMSGHAPDTLASSGLEESMSFLSKPFSPADLMDRVAAILEEE
jgi:two-component system, cell cycle sensor histidine kinase and response regulator CckA